MTNRLVLHYVGILATFVWGVVLLYFYVSGRLDIAVAPSFHPLVLAGGIGLILLSVYNLLVNHPTEHDDCGHDYGDDDHEHHHHDESVSSQLIALLILVAPLVAAASYSEDKYSLDAIEKKNLYSNSAAPTRTEKLENKEGDNVEDFTVEDLERYVDKSADGNFLIAVPDLFYSASDPVLQNVLAQVKIETTAQVVKEKLNNPNGTRLRIFRMFSECCAADSRPIGIPVEFGQEPPKFKDMEWVKVVGTVDYPEEQGKIVPVFQPDSIEPTEEPKSWLQY